MDQAPSSIRILIIEDSSYYSEMVQDKIHNILGFETVIARSYEEAKNILEKDTDFFVALVDLILPDAEEGEIVDLVISKNVAPIILTGNFDEDLRERILSKRKVVDYVFKRETKGFKVITDLIKKLIGNQSIKVLIAEDSATQRFQLKRLLEVQKYQVLEASDGDAAFRIAEANPDIQLVLTDYNMPVIDGFELVGLLRRKYDKDQLSIIGLSAEGNSYLAARFLKAGASDFLTKPIFSEELIARVSKNIEYLDMVNQLKELAIKDPLTKLFNRRYFYDEGERLFQEIKLRKKPVALGMVDIDYFKKINDRHGHHVGDDALREISRILLDCTRGSDIVSRFGGEEFCILAMDTDIDGAKFLFEKIRKRIEGCELSAQGEPVRFTASFGVAGGYFFSLNDMVRQADQMLYEAKAQGRNRVNMSFPKT